jgi:hypothetical protein
MLPGSGSTPHVLLALTRGYDLARPLLPPDATLVGHAGGSHGRPLLQGDRSHPAVSLVPGGPDGGRISPGSMAAESPNRLVASPGIGGRASVDARIVQLAAFAEGIASRQSHVFEQTVKVAYAAGASREDLLTAVEVGRCLEARQSNVHEDSARGIRMPN